MILIYFCVFYFFCAKIIFFLCIFWEDSVNLLLACVLCFSELCGNVVWMLLGALDDGWGYVACVFPWMFGECREACWMMDEDMFGSGLVCVRGVSRVMVIGLRATMLWEMGLEWRGARFARAWNSIGTALEQHLISNTAAVHQQVRHSTCTASSSIWVQRLFATISAFTITGSFRVFLFY